MWLKLIGDRGVAVASRPAALSALDKNGGGMTANQVTAAFITYECRLNRGNTGAWEEAVERLRAHYDLIVKGWADHAEQPTLNLVLEMERP